MKKNDASTSGLFNPRVLFTLALCSVSLFFAALGFAVSPGTAGWSLVTSPSKDTGTFTSNWLYAATCRSTSDCWAVGNYVQNNYDQTLVEHWNGTAWSIASSPNTSPTQNNDLKGVACGSASDCWAVGSGFTSASNTQTLIEHWDGTSWTIFGQASPGSLNAVTCNSASDCWAVGSTILHWGGSSWANYGSVAAFLYSVSCVSGSDCWAVGGTLIEHWDGASWTSFTEPNSGGEGNPDSLGGVACASTSDCWAVGSIATGVETGATLIEHWNGSSWAIVSSPNPASDSSGLSNVTCVSASECWANGGYNPPSSGYTRTLLEYWNGSSWAIVNSPNPSSRYNTLRGVTCGSASECWAVGDQVTASGAQVTLFEEYSPTIPPLMAVASRKIHGNAGTFDVDLPLVGTRGVECRNPGATGTAGVDYKLVFSFVNNVTNCGTASTGSLSSGPGSNQCTVDLSGVANQQYVTVTLNSVLDSQNNTGNVSATMGVLVGDVNASGVVTSGDTNLCKAQALQPVTTANFRNDVNASGAITTGDVNLIKQNALHQLPSPP